MKSFKDICEVIVVRMAELVTEAKTPTHIQEGDIIFFCPKDRTFGFQRPTAGSVDFLFFDSSYDSKGYFAELYDKAMCDAVARELARRMSFSVRKIRDEEDRILCYQFLKP